MVTIESLAAGYGDALLVTYGPTEAPTRLLIDGGLTGSAKGILKRLEEIDARIDLLVITHIDADHISGAVRLLNTPSFTQRLGGVWFNGREHLEQYNDLLGALDGERVDTQLEKLGLPWNSGWPWRHTPLHGRAEFGGPVVIDDSPVRVPLPGGATAIVLSPTPAKLVKLLPVWRETIRKAGLVDGVALRRDPAEPAPRVLLGGPTLHELAARKTSPDGAEANGSSIAFVLEVPDAHGPHRLLLTGDAHPDVLVAGLQHLRGRGDPYPIDICKLPHHASRSNVTAELVEQIACRRWIVSTNGKRFNHPNDESLARVVVASPGSTIYGNYHENAPLASFVTRYPPDQHGYVLEQPPAGKPGVTVALGS